MSAVLGISAHYHDAAAALVVDGVVVAAMQEERFTRVKHDRSLPVHAARACLRLAGLNTGDLDAVVYYEDPYAKLERVMVALLRTFPRSWRQFPRAVAGQIGERVWVLDAIAAQIGVPRQKVSHTTHHRAHAASAFFVSPYPSAAVLTVDGVGETATTAIWHGTGDSLRMLSALDYPHSLGLLYAAITAWLGFDVNEGEFKVMGLAAFGRPTRRDAFARLIRFESDGSFALDTSYLGDLTDPDLAFGPKLEALLGPRRASRPWNLDSPADRACADVAATLQAVTEDALLGLCRAAKLRTGEDALCLAGGVALNAVANARIARESGFSRIFVQPAAGDAGGALGAAIDGAMARGDPRPEPLASCALGLPTDPAALSAIARALGLKTTRVDPVAEAADRIAQGQIVAWVTGRSEWGPRALGNRSILASPASAATRDRINALIKRREPFRPFAPAVTADQCHRWFDGPPDDMTPFMTTVRQVLRDDLGAVTHVDGTARVQTVSAGPLAPLLSALNERTGAPIALNTSLNGPGDPIVGTERDALAFFLAHPVDALFVDDVLVERP